MMSQGFARQRRLPPRSGVGFKPQHFEAIIERPQPIGFFEIHAENYMGDGGPPHARLARLRADYSLSIHGVGLSIGSPEPLDEEHLARLKKLCDRYEPESFSEHLAWASHDGAFMNDLLPLPYTAETLDRIVDHVDRVQEVLGRRMLLENPATYILFRESTIEETDFLAALARRTGCGLLLDVNNVFVSAINHNLDPLAYINRFPLTHVGEIHLGGHAVTVDDQGAPLLIDSHDSLVRDPVWALYETVISRTSALPSLVEWDNDVPDWETLKTEAVTAQAILDRFAAGCAA